MNVAKRFFRSCFCLCFAMANVLWLVSCGELEKENPAVLFGLPHVAIEMRKSDFSALLKDDLVNEYAAMTIEKNGIKTNGRIRRRGHFSRYFPKPSFHTVTKDGEWHYVAANLDKTYCREIFGYRIFEKYGFLTPKTEHVALSVNGVYLGLYISREPIDEKFFARRNIAVNSLYQIRSGGQFTFSGGRNSAIDFEKIIPATPINYNDLNALIRALDENNDETLNRILHIENAAKYSLVSSAINNYDGVQKNLFAGNFEFVDTTEYRQAVSRNKFAIIPYDLDLTFGQTGANGFVVLTDFPKFSNGLLERAEEIYLQNLDRRQRIFAIMDEIYDDGIRYGFLDNLARKILQAYLNDPYLAGENLDEHIADLKAFIVNFL